MFYEYLNVSFIYFARDDLPSFFQKISARPIWTKEPVVHRLHDGIMTMKIAMNSNTMAQGATIIVSPPWKNVSLNAVRYQLNLHYRTILLWNRRPLCQSQVSQITLIFTGIYGFSIRLPVE